MRYPRKSLIAASTLSLLILGGCGDNNVAANQLVDTTTRLLNQIGQSSSYSEAAEAFRQANANVQTLRRKYASTEAASTLNETMYQATGYSLNEIDFASRRLTLLADATGSPLTMPTTLEAVLFPLQERSEVTLQLNLDHAAILAMRGEQTTASVLIDQLTRQQPDGWYKDPGYLGLLVEKELYQQANELLKQYQPSISVNFYSRMIAAALNNQAYAYAGSLAIKQLEQLDRDQLQLMIHEQPKLLNFYVKLSHPTVQSPKALEILNHYKSHFDRKHPLDNADLNYMLTLAVALTHQQQPSAASTLVKRVTQQLSQRPQAVSNNLVAELALAQLSIGESFEYRQQLKRLLQFSHYQKLSFAEWLGAYGHRDKAKELLKQIAGATDQLSDEYEILVAANAYVLAGDEVASKRLLKRLHARQWPRSVQHNSHKLYTTLVCKADMDDECHTALERTAEAMRKQIVSSNASTLIATLQRQYAKAGLPLDAHAQRVFEQLAKQVMPPNLVSKL